MRIKRKTVRKLVTLSAATMAKVDRHQLATEAPTTSDTLRMLIEDGLRARDERAGHGPAP